MNDDTDHPYPNRPTQSDIERMQIAAALRRIRRPQVWRLPAGLTEEQLLTGYDRASIVTLGAVAASAIAVWFGVSPWGA